jgi:cytochrome c553
MKNVVTINLIKLLKLTLVLLFITSCSNKDLKQHNISLNNIVQNNDTIKALSLLELKCYSCHSISSNSHNEIIAPPLAAVKHRYLRSYPNKEEFVNAMSQWIQEPKEENALMRGAVQKFKVMPYLLVSQAEAKVIATFIYENDLSSPSWFQEHFNQEHQNGKGRGNGFKNNNQQNFRKNRF